MIIFYRIDTGELTRFQVGTLINALTCEADGYLVVDPGGKFTAPEAGEAPFNLNDLSDPVLADSVAQAIYQGTGRYRVNTAADPVELVEVM